MTHPLENGSQTFSTNMPRNRFLSSLSLLILAAALQACGPTTHTLVKPHSPTNAATIFEPAKREVVIVINNNSLSGTHAGIFAGSRLNDPSGSYVGKRSEDKSWPGPSLSDYVEFQKEDGFRIELYRFQLESESFNTLDARMAAASPTPPLFCAVEVNNLIAGLEPFTTIPKAGWISPAELARQLEKLNHKKIGKCEMPDGTPC